jgi:hypothetical protein
MKKLFLIICLSFIASLTYSQIFYKNQLETIEGVEIKYRFAKPSFFNKDNPLSLRFKLKNTNDHHVTVSFEVVYYLNIVDKFESGLIEICIPRKSARTGRMHGLSFEMNINNPDIFEEDGNNWELETFDVKKIEDCKLFNDDNKN